MWSENTLEGGLLKGVFCRTTILTPRSSLLAPRSGLLAETCQRA